MSYKETSHSQYLRRPAPVEYKFGPYADITARDAIPTDDRYDLMLVGVLDSDGSGTRAIYILSGGVTNSDWIKIGQFLSGGMGISITNDVIDLGGGLTLTGQRIIEIAAGAGPTNQLRINIATGETVRKWVQAQQDILSWFGNETDVGFAGSGVEDGGAGNFPGTGPIAGFYSKSIGAAGTVFGGGMYASADGFVHVWPGALRSDMKGIKYDAVYAGIDWAGDLAGSGLLLATQKRVEELIAGAGIGTPLNIKLWYVMEGGSDSNSGHAPGISLLTVQEAVDQAVSGDIIYVGSSADTIDAVIPTGKDLTFIGVPTDVERPRIDPVIDDSTTVVFKGLTVDLQGTSAFLTNTTVELLDCNTDIGCGMTTLIIDGGYESSWNADVTVRTLEVKNTRLLSIREITLDFRATFNHVEFERGENYYYVTGGAIVYFIDCSLPFATLEGTGIGGNGTVELYNSDFGYDSPDLTNLTIKYYNQKPNFGGSNYENGVNVATGVGASVNLQYKQNNAINVTGGTTLEVIELTGNVRGQEVIVRGTDGQTITLKHNDAGATVKMLFVGEVDRVLSSSQDIVKFIILPDGSYKEYGAATAISLFNPTNEIFVDINNGNNTTGDGTKNNPYLTIERAWTDRILDQAATYTITVTGSEVYPASLSLNGSGTVTTAIETHIRMEQAGTGRWKHGFSNITLKDAGYVYFSGIGTYSGTLTLDARTASVPSCIGFSSVEVDFNLTIVGTPLSDCSVYLMDSVVAFLQNFTGNFTRTDLLVRGGSAVRLFQNATFRSISMYAGGIELLNNRTLNVTGSVLLSSGASLGLSTGTTTTLNIVDHNGGYISRSSGGALTIITNNYNSRPSSKYHYFDNSGSALVATDVEAAIKEAAISRFAFGQSWARGVVANVLDMDIYRRVFLLPLGNTDIETITATGIKDGEEILITNSLAGSVHTIKNLSGGGNIRTVGEADIVVPDITPVRFIYSLSGDEFIQSNAYSGSAAHDYKTWSVDLTNGVDTNDGSDASPFLTINAAFTARDTDGAAYGIIRVKGSGSFDTQTIPTGTLKTTLVFDDGVFAEIPKSSSFTITDRDDLTIVNCGNIADVRGQTIDLVQTGTNPMALYFKNCHDVYIGESAINDYTFIDISFDTCTEMTLDNSVSTLESHETRLLLQGTTYDDVRIYGGGILVDETGAGAMTIAQFILERCDAYFRDTVCTITTQLRDEAVVFGFEGTGAINPTGTRSTITGEFAEAGGAPLETIQSLTVTNANYTAALILAADTNIVEITLDAALTNDWQPATITGWVIGRSYTWFIIKKSNNSVDLSTARAVPNVGFDDDIDPFTILDTNIDTTVQRAVIDAKGFKTTFGQFGRMIITDTGYAE